MRLNLETVIDLLISLVNQYNVDLYWLLSEELICTKEMTKDEFKLINAYRQLQGIAKEEVYDFIKFKLVRYKNKSRL